MARRIAFFVFLAALLLGSSAAMPRGSAVFAGQPTPADDQVNAIAQELFCPVCENVPLDVCPTEACRQWRELIRQMLSEGKSEEEIKQYFVENYGARVLSEPPRQGLNWLAYIVPPVAFLVGVYLLFRAFRTWKRLAREPEAGPGSATAAPADDEYAARFEAELKKRK
jgi:cytochrome c-type biogenesis protein CcmH